MAAEELTLRPPHLPCDGVGEEKMPSLLCPLLSVQVRDLAMKVRELTLPHTSCSTRENRPCILPGLHIRADPIVGGAHEPDLRL